MADRALIVCLHAVLAAGGGNLSDQVAVLVTGLNNYIIFVGDLILAISIPIEITTSLAFPIFLVARFGAGSRLGVHLFQVVGVRGRRHAAGDGESTGSRRKCNIFLIIVTNIILVSGVLKSHNRITICNPCIHRKRKLQECTYTAVVLTMIPKQLSALCCQRSGHSLALRNFSERQFRLIISDR